MAQRRPAHARHPRALGAPGRATPSIVVRGKRVIRGDPSHWQDAVRWSSAYRSSLVNDERRLPRRPSRRASLDFPLVVHQRARAYRGLHRRTPAPIPCGGTWRHTLGLSLKRSASRTRHTFTSHLPTKFRCGKRSREAAFPKCLLVWEHKARAATELGVTSAESAVCSAPEPGPGTSGSGVAPPLVRSWRRPPAPPWRSTRACSGATAQASAAMLASCF